MKGEYSHFSSFFMRINNLIAKIHSKFKFFILKHFGNNKKANIIIKIFISMIIASDYYYYIADRGYPALAVFLVCSLILYILVSLFTYLCKNIYLLLKRFRANNVVLFILLVYVINSALIKCKNDSKLLKSDILIMSLIVGIIIFLFSKSLVSFVVNKKKISFPIFIITAISVIFILAFLVFPGYSEKSAIEYAEIGTEEIEDPAQFSSKLIEYGNKNPKEISLLNYVSYSGKKKKIRDTYFDKSLLEVPIKGRIWYPQNKEKSPVLFIAHGNHRFTEENYKGYDYLGRYLARRGYVTVSVDMNMLNGFMKYGLSGENDARAILLLENIKEVLALNNNKNSKLYNLIDEENIVIAGHSRGGEAVAIAENYNKIRYNPDNGKEYNYNFNIKGVISISPTVDQYNPSGKDIKLKDVNFLTIHGTHDKDVTGFQGMKLYNNTYFTEESNNFKSAVYVAYANHGQFNSRWGSADTDPPQSLIVNKKSLLEVEEQEEILCKYVYEFLQNTFGFTNDKTLFKNPQRVNMPKTLYYARYSDSSFKNLVDFEEDYDLTTSKSGKIRFDNMSKVSEQEISIGGYNTNNTAVYLSNNKNGIYQISLDELEDAREYLQFDVKTKRQEKFEDIDLSVELVDDYGNSSKLDISDYLNIYPDIKVELSKLQLLSNSYNYKGSFQTVRIPIDDFILRDKLVRTNIKYINFVFGDDYSSSILLDDIGFSN
ncbi:MFS transporter [Peptoniphilus stercorisuis]|uniref:Dienelactone hydrolase n=1 Tax=Peptoniphilus stercorisuis TaxID=1436965 RepID=A0ABS4KAT4_9FIRM|nr:MFS transporter [Peptoniphilus stercorisuis]MBP2024894.1 dienelactone hydrolase [Peptoniphilus stercorisuis]